MDEDEEFESPEVVDPGGAPKTLIPKQSNAPGYRGVNRKLGWGAAFVVIAVVVLGIWTILNRHDPAPASANPTTALLPTTDQPLPDPTSKPVVRQAEGPRPVQTGPAPQQIAAAAPPAPAQLQQPQQRVQSPEELAAQEELKRRIDARRTSSRMALEAPDTGATQQQIAALGGASSNPMSNQSAPGSTVGATGSAAMPSSHGQFASQTSAGVGYVAPTSGYEINETTIIPARLITAVDSTLPGLIKAQVITAVYDSRTHSAVVIPAGAVLVGQYDSQTIAGEARLMAVWTRILFPDGRSFLMGAGQGSGAKGESGMSASVDNHTGRAFGAAFLYTMLGAAGNLVSNAINRNSSVIELGNVAQSVQQPQRPAPTMHLYPGALFNVMVTQDLPLERYDPSN